MNVLYTLNLRLVSTGQRRVSCFTKNKNIVIQKSDKSNFVVIVAKTDYLDKMENFLNDARKFEKSNLKNNGFLSFPVNQEKWVENIFVIKFTKMSSIIGRLFYLFCQQLILPFVN